MRVPLTLRASFKDHPPLFPLKLRLLNDSVFEVIVLPEDVEVKFTNDDWGLRTIDEPPALLIQLPATLQLEVPMLSVYTPLPLASTPTPAPVRLTALDPKLIAPKIPVSV